MYLTQSNVIRSLSKEEYAMLREMCQYSNNLYNVALYHIRQYFFQEKKFLRYEENYHVCKVNENYRLLQAGISQQILKVVDRSFKSFFNLIKKQKAASIVSKILTFRITAKRAVCLTSFCRRMQLVSKTDF